MKLTFLFLLIGLMHVSASVYSQSTKLSLEMRNAKVAEVLDAIERQSEFRFAYSPGFIDLEREVTVDINEKTIGQSLKVVFANTDVAFGVFDRHILLYPNEMAPGNRPVISHATGQQQNSVSGTVTDESGEPLPGVTVVVKGTTQGTVTNADGEYSLTNIPEDATLQFSFVGMLTQEIEVGNQASIDVTMTVDAIGLEEVVAVGYGTRKKVNLTGSVATVSNEELTIAPVASSTSNLAGKLPGLIVKQEVGTPGSDGARLSIRGYDNPLVIVDGVQRGFNEINPNEIESISILKDASAAIYGSRAGNGVILVTTKRGRIGKPVINLGVSYTGQGVTQFPRPVNAGQYATLMNEAYGNAGRNMPYTQEDIDLYFSGEDPIGHPNTDWFDELMQKWSPMMNYDLSVRGGSEKIKYYGMLSYLDQEGMPKTGDLNYKRYNARMNVDAEITDRLTVSLDMSAIKDDINRPWRFTGNAGIWFFMDMMNAHPTRHASFPDPTKIPYHGMGAMSPIGDGSREIGGYRDEDRGIFNGTISFDYEIPKIQGLLLKGLASYLQNSSENKTFSKKYPMYNYDWENDIYSLARYSAIPTRLDQRYNHAEVLTGQLSLNYSRIFKNVHTVDALLLFESISDNSHWFRGYRENYLTSAIDYLFAGGTEGQVADGRAAEGGRQSWVGRINYNYKGKYLAEVTARYDGSPRFFGDNQWGLFPSASLGWRLSEESFIKDNASWISNFKLRAGISQTGNDNTGAFQYLTGYQYSGSYVIGGSVHKGLNSTGIANPNITWEEMTNYNVGADFAVLEGKLYAELDLFYRLREGMLATRLTSLPNTFGASLPAENINSQSNRGIEFLLGQRKAKGDFKYDISAYVAYARAKWEHFEEPEYTDPDDIRINQRTGQWTDLFFGYRTDGLFTNQEEIDALDFNQDTKGNTTIKPGYIRYVDRNNDGELNWRDKEEVGYGRMPLLTGGLNMNASYKNFDLTALFQGAGMFSIRLVNVGVWHPRTPIEAQWKYRWTPENPDPNALFPVVDIAGKNNWMRGGGSDFDIFDCSYLRLKQISFGYSLPGQWLDAVHIDKARIYFSGTNLFTLSDMPNKLDIDPEAAVGNNQVRPGGWFYPQSKTFSFGINLTF